MKQAVKPPKHITDTAIYCVPFPVRIDDSPYDAWALRYRGDAYYIVLQREEGWVDYFLEDLDIEEEALNEAALLLHAQQSLDALANKRGVKDAIVEDDVRWSDVCRLIVKHEGNIEGTFNELYELYNVELEDWQIASCAGLNEGNW